MRGSMAIMALALSLAGGCVRDALVPCGELACPAGDVCTATGCASEEQVAACGDLLEDAACSAPTVMAGHCRDGVCRSSICGNGTQDFGEACDDGNTSSEDGCSARCDSIEVCGDRVIDAAIGEQCDDGTSGQSADGCTSLCTVELPAWEDVSPTALAPRHISAMAYDATRGVTVMYGGTLASGSPASDTWEWNGVAWRQRFSASTPGGRTGHAMAYDAQRGHIVLFGGVYGSLSTTWTWDGTTWRDVTPTVSPEASYSASLTYVGGGKMLMFGGGDQSGTARQETWQWDGTSWTLLQPTQMPPPRAGHVMAYDPGCGCAILFGGITSSFILLGDTWKWNGADWQELSPASQPSPRSGAGIAFDVERQHVMLFGGRTESGRSNELFEWIGDRWVTPSQSTPPAPRELHAMAYDANRQELVVFSGLEGSTLGETAETFSLDGTSWRMRSTTLPPRRFTNSFAAYDAARGQLVMFGGRSAVQTSDDTWLWDGTQWLATEPAQKPPGRNNHVMAYDSGRQRVLVVGGPVGSPTSDVWEWDGATWIDRTQAGALAPPDRQVAGMAYDPVRQRLVYFGGVDTVNNITYADTWEWADGVWTQLAPAHSPPSTSTTMAYDPSRQRVVLVGAVTTDSPSALWEWDGTDWTLAVPSTSLTELGALVYHPLLRRLLIVGITKTWEWAGSDWVALPLTRLPTAAAFSRAIAFDAIRRRIVLVGRQSFTPDQRAWTLGFESPFSLPDRCSPDLDSDGDGFAGCEDPDCRGVCDPMCAIDAICSGPRPTCGDGTCSVIEDYLVCPADCPAP